jgi:hypothetical protein
MLSGILLVSACHTMHTAGRSGKVPPGQAKKYNGQKKGNKSAKQYAPGQRKKH